MDRPRLMSVSEAAAELKVSEAYVRWLLLSQRLYGIKIGPVWAIFPNDLDAFRQLRRRPGRPPKAQTDAQDQASTAPVAGGRKHPRTDGRLRKRGGSP